MNKENQQPSFFAKHYVGVTFLVILALLAGLYFVFVAPAYWAYVELNRVSLEAEQERLQALKDDLSVLEKLQSNFEDLSSRQVEEIESVVPSEREVPNLLVNLDGLARASGNEVVDMSFAIRDKKEKVGLDRALGKTERQGVIENLTEALASESYPFAKLWVLTVNLKVKGTGYSDFKKFIETVEKNLRIMDIKDFQFDPKQEIFSLSLETYFIGLAEAGE